GFVRDDGTPVARLIEIEDPDKVEIAVSGEVQRKGDSVLVVRHVPFETTDRTEIIDERGDPFPFEEIQVGMFVSVKGILFPATRRAVALKIEVRTKRFVRLVGTINEIGTDAISVSGIRVFVTDMTAIVGSNGEPLEFADLRVGQIVKVEGWKGLGGIVARSITVRLRVEDEVLVTGILEAVEDSSVVLLGVPFRVLSDTQILDSDRQEKALADLEIGRPIRVRGELLADGTLIALTIKELDHGVRGINVIGPIESIAASTIEVIGIHFFVDGSTDIRGVAGASLGLEDLEVGQTVALQGVGRPDGTRLALKIRLLDVLVAMGEADVLASDRVQMFGVDLATESDLMVLRDGITQTTLTQSQDLQATVEIRAATDESGEMRVSKVTLHQDSGSTTVTIDDGSEIPSAFELGQNYPNPFNPATTIRLNVYEAGAVNLAVYNLLGQRVATLVDQSLPVGTYSFEWNGRDASGAPAASGLYLYRAAVDGTVQTRTMTLIK
ncbi:MAG: T9SS type A sorting domain-containing protein, partial [Rhodothermia bacterium]|nr:T9SS type A sorting domain-containing protein [Rhodothermia bacterium]